MNTIKILIVEDERIVALDLQRRLVKLGYPTPAMAASAEQTMLLIDEFNPDLVLMDIHIDGDVDGIETAHRIRRSRQIPLIFLTAYSEESTLARARQTLPYGYLIKPFSERELHTTIQVAVERHRADMALAGSEERLRLALDAAQLGTWELSPEVPETFCHEFGAAPSGIALMQLFDNLDAFLSRVHADDRQRVAATMQQMRVPHHPPCEIGFRVEDSTGNRRWIKLYGKTYAHDAKLAPRTVGVIQDVTERHRVEERLRQAATAFECANEAILLLDACKQIDSVNGAFSQITGYSNEEIRGQKLLLENVIHSIGETLDAMWATVDATGRWQGEIRAFRKTGERFFAWLSIATIKDAQEQVTHYVLVFSDISALRLAHEQLWQLAHYDTLTGLPNRTLVLDRLDQALLRAKHHKLYVGLLFIDVDHFKRVNDTLGHQVGDRLLQIIAQRIRGCAREVDTIGRLGGDEFVLVVELADKISGVVKVADKLIASLGAPILLDGHTLQISASIGISLFPIDANDRDGLMRSADTAMYAAKERGRNTYAHYVPEMTERVARYLARDQELRRALAQTQLVLHYQPQIDMDTRRLIGVEALIRWQHPSRGLLGAAEVIPTAEESGLIVEIGEWVLREACRQTRTWLDAGLPAIRIAVNLSARQMENGELPALVTRLLNEYRLEAGCLELELTESALQNEQNCVATLRELKRRGISIAIDDFGTGYSCLSSLKLLPISRIKIDQSFVRGVPSDANDQAIATIIIAMGRQLNLQVIAEGIESPDQAAFIQGLGCTEAQGYFYGGPQPPEAIAERLRDEYKP